MVVSLPPSCPSLLRISAQLDKLVDINEARSLRHYTSSRLFFFLFFFLFFSRFFFLSDRLPVTSQRLPCGETPQRRALFPFLPSLLFPRIFSFSPTHCDRTIAWRADVHDPLFLLPFPLPFLALPSFFFPFLASSTKSSSMRSEFNSTASPLLFLRILFFFFPLLAVQTFWKNG